MKNLSTSATGPLAGIAAALLVLIGSVGPWARVWFITVSGLDGDGKYTAGLALVCGGLLAYRAMKSDLSRWIPLATTAMFVVCLALGTYYLVDIQSLVNESQADDGLVLVQVGWGLYVLVLGAIAGIAASIIALRADTHKQAREVDRVPLVSEA